MSATIVRQGNGAGLEAEQTAAYRFLQREAAAQGLVVTLRIEQAARRGSVMTLPVHVDDDADVLETAQRLQSLEDAWNAQEPRPGLTLILRPVN